MSVNLQTKIDDCRQDCPWFISEGIISRMQRAFAPDYLCKPEGYRYTCRKAARVIDPDDGVKPPPQWCPMRTGGRDD